MSAISATFSNLWSKVPMTPSFSGKVGLPVSSDEPLTGKSFGGNSEKCELRIEGMTCGACVEVSEFIE